MNHIFLYGPPACGKSTIGQILGRNLEMPFVDLDHAVEAKAGMSIPQILERQGESAFRDLESAALQGVLPGKDSVIALGGGSLLRVENRTLVEENGRVVLLKAESEILLNRLKSDSNKRPLLQGNMGEKLSSLLEKRESHYDSFSLNVHVDGMTAEQNAHHIQVVLGRFHLSALGQYDVIVQRNGMEPIGDLLIKLGLKNPIVVTDSNVETLHAGKVLESLQKSEFNPSLLTIPAGEAYKNLDTINKLWHDFIDNGVDRKSTIIALGGGVVGDMAGFAASTFMRGVSWIAMPTTLLAMVDASIGGKTGFDLPEGKNLIGSFYPPKLVLADPQVLKTLFEAELISGLAEVVKAGIISDPELFHLCARGLDWVKNNLEELVKRAMAVKIKVIEEDPYERGIRATLNLGHTIGHAVELVSRFQIRHGEAVAIGMVAEARLAERLTIAGKGLSDTFAESLSALSLPVYIPKDLPREDLIRAMRRDKKKTNSIVRFALPAEIGRVELVDVDDLEMVLEE